MKKQIPMVDYLVLGDGEPYLAANACDGCGALFLDRRNGCAKCGGRTFSRKPLAREGTLRSFTIVHRAAPGIKAPFVSAIVDLADGGMVKSNLGMTDPDPVTIKLGMPVRLTTYPIGTDDEGTEAVAFGFVPA